MLASKVLTVFVGLSAILAVYLFVSAPAPIAEAGARDDGAMSVKHLLELCAAENDAVRGLYTREIVGKGKGVGLRFAEDWGQPGVEAGPLPALFLRATAKSLEKDPVRLGLFLGSDFPISRANLFAGRQAEVFKLIRADEQARHFFVEDLELYTAMFPDLAVAPACVSCHNEHPDTKKNDWKLGDVMGATTWTYPRSSVTPSEALEVLAALRRGFVDAYGGYVDKAHRFKKPPVIGERWPEDGYFLPSPEVFMRELERRASSETLRRLLAQRK
jgi:hypothetical protein